MTETRTRAETLFCEQGSRTDLVAALRRMSVECYLLGKDALSRAACEAVNDLEAGALSVQVGRTTYSVDYEKE